MALSNAERQRRYRERKPRGHDRRDQRTRHQQWRDAIATIITLRDVIPEAFEASPTAERLDEVLDQLEDVDWQHLAALVLPATGLRPR